jgi:hypothetical protein
VMTDIITNTDSKMSATEIKKSSPSKAPKGDVDIQAYVPKELKLKLKLKLGSENVACAVGTDVLTGQVDVDTPANTSVKDEKNGSRLMIDRSQKAVLDSWSSMFLRSECQREDKVFSNRYELLNIDLEPQNLVSNTRRAIGELFNLRATCDLAYLGWYKPGCFTDRMSVARIIGSDAEAKDSPSASWKLAIVDMTADSSDIAADVESGGILSVGKKDQTSDQFVPIETVASHKRMTVTLLDRSMEYSISPVTSGYRLFAFFKIICSKMDDATINSHRLISKKIDESKRADLRADGSLGMSNAEVLAEAKHRGFNGVGFICGTKYNATLSLQPSVADFDLNDYHKYRALKKLTAHPSHEQRPVQLIQVMYSGSDSYYNAELHDIVGHTGGGPKRLKVTKAAKEADIATGKDDKTDEPKFDESGRYAMLSNDPRYRLGDVLVDNSGHRCDCGGDNYDCDCRFVLVVFDL